MQNIVDVIGCAIASYYNGDKQGELIIREDYRTTAIPTANFFRDPNEVVQDRIALSYCRRRVLNIGASSGEHSLYLINRGLKVTSIDTSPVACAIMQKRGLQTVVCGSVFEQHALIDDCYTWLAVRGVIGQLGNIRKFCTFLQLAQQKILPNGRLILSSTNLSHEGYRSRSLSFEYADNISNLVPWFDIGISTLKQLAYQHQFDCRIIYCDESNKYIALLTRQ